MPRGNVGREGRGLGVTAALIAALSVTAAAATASAQSDAELDRARQAFAEGVEASDAGRWDEAVARFREVMEVRATPQVKYNLAVALDQTGEYVEAETLLREAVDDPDLDGRTRTEAEELLEAVGPRAEQQRAAQEAEAAEVPTPEQTAQQSVIDEELLAEPEEQDGGGSIFGEWWFWTGVGAVVVGAVLVGILVASGGDEDPVRGNLEPGVLKVSP